MRENYDDDDSDNSQENEKLSMEKDFEGGKWIGEEFYFQEQKRGRTQTSDESLYGVFAGDDSDNEADNSKGKSKGKGNNKIRNNDKKRTRSDKPLEFIAQKSSKVSKDDTVEATAAVPDDIEVKDETEDFKNVLGNLSIPEVKAVKKDTKSNDDFRLMMEEAEAGVFRSNKIVAPGAVSTKSLGTWEKHTKGVGMKYLEKFGFKGRLGAREDGVSRAIEVVVRPNGQGLGFGDFTEQGALPVNKKLVAEWSGVEYKEEEIITEIKKSKKIMSEEISESKSWKKGGQKEKKVKIVSMNDFLNTDAGDGNINTHKKEVIIDMRGEQTRIITDYTDMNSLPSSTDGPKLGQELLYNINLVVDLVEMDLNANSKKLGVEKKKINNILNDIEMLEKQIEKDSPRLKKLENILAILNKVNEKQIKSKNRELNIKDEDDDHDENDFQYWSNKNNSDIKESITLTAVSALFKTLHQNYKEEFHMFGLIHLLPTVLLPVLQTLFINWVPLSDPLRLAEIFTAGSGLGEYFDINGEGALAAQTRSIVETIGENLTLPLIRRTLTKDWDVHNPHQCVTLLDTMKSIYPIKTVEELIDTFIQPKLIKAVKNWSPNVDIIPIHTWIHQWLPLMKAKLAPLYPDIRRKMSQALSTWQPDDIYAIQLIHPWRDIFDKISMDTFLIRMIIPKLVINLRNIIINPSNQDVSMFNKIAMWYDIIPSVHFISLFKGEFFARWLRVLVTWLSSSPDLEEIVQWYLGWKSVFPEKLLEEPDMLESFNSALDIMNIALTAKEHEYGMLLKKAGSDVLDTSYFNVVEKKISENSMKDRLQELNKSSRYTPGTVNEGIPSTRGVLFKEVVETFAANNGITFIPKVGRVQDGKQVFMFGKSLCYLDQDVVFVSTATKTVTAEWRPIGLEELLKISL